MRHLIAARVGSVVILTLFLIAPSLRAGERVHISYEAPDDCPTRADFVDRVLERGAALAVPQDDVATSLAVTIRASDSGFVGELRLERPGADSAPREVHDPDCERVVEGLAVVAAIALGAPLVNDEAAPSAPQLEAEPKPVASEPESAPESERASALVGSSYAAPSEIEVEAGTLHFAAARSYTLRAGADIGVAPGLILPRYDLTASLASFIRTPADSSYLVGNVLQVNWSLLGPGTFTSEDGFSADLMGLQAGLNSCSAFSYDTRGWVLLGCAEFGVGVSWVDTRAPGGALLSSKEAGLGFAGVGVDAQYNFGRLFHLGARLGGRFQVGGPAPERPDGSALFETPLFGGYLTAGVGLHF